MPKEKKRKAAAEKSLPKHPPRRSGRRGIGPALDPLTDFETPVTTAQSEAVEAGEAPPEKPKRKRPVQKELPGMESRRLEDVEDAAREYANLRDDRMNLTRREVDQKETLLTLMRKHGKEIYRVEEMEIKVVPTDVKLKVRILEEKE